jgi:hypothetical protein
MKTRVVEVETHYESLASQCKLELLGAESRLAAAQSALQDFYSTNSIIVDGSQCLRASSIDMRESLDREEHSLRIEIDSASRLFQKCLADWSALR